MQPPAGWYPDPNGTGNWRWWDGQSWTDHVQAPAPQPAASGPSGSPSRLLAVLIAFLVLVAGAAVGILVLGGDDESSTGAEEQVQPVKQPLPADQQPDLVAADDRAKNFARTAQTTIEAYAVDFDGSYVGVAVPYLVDIEPSLAAVSLLLPEPSTDDTYVVAVESEKTGNTFSIRRLASGAIEQTCEERGNAGCPESGRW